MIAVYFSLGEIIKWVLPYTKYYYMPGFVAEMAANQIRPDISYPVSSWFDMKGIGRIVLIPYYVLIGYLVVLAHLLAKPFYKYLFATALAAIVFLRVFPGTLLLFQPTTESVALGKPSKGSLESGKRMAYSGKGYITYSFAAFLAGRTYVHGQVHSALVQAFEQLGTEYHDWRFVLGDASLRHGGPMSFQAEKQNGMQVDIMLPLYHENKPYRGLWCTNFWNYGLEMSDDGTLNGKQVDYAVLGRMLAAMYAAAQANGLVVQKIEMHPDVKRNLLGKNIISLIKDVLGHEVRRDSKAPPAYFTVTFAPSPAKGSFLNRVLGGEKRERNAP
ncbi:MAG: penicillin-insensitive murein endopeptidase [Bacteroidetes bacterium]|nr:penicillin-insensitive murein endopeptidase [Bacteroidota bacterium]